MIKITAFELNKNEFGIEAHGAPDPSFINNSLLRLIDNALNEKNSYEVLSFTPNEHRQTCSLQIRVLDRKLELIKNLIKRLESEGLSV
jgi:hypothetical protein